MIGAGALRDRYTFQTRGPDLVRDGLDQRGDWGGDLTVWASTRPLVGSEAVQAERLQGKQPAVITVRASSATKAIDNSWRAVDARDASQVYDILSAVPSADLATIDILAVRQAGQTSDG